MPKIITEEERKKTKKLILKNTHKLICKKRGIDNFTVDDIVKTAKIGKAKFYTFFNSKEECLFEVVEYSYIEQLKKYNQIMNGKGSFEEKLHKFLKEVYLSEENINYYFSPEDFNIIMSKLPSEFSKREKVMSSAVIGSIMSHIQISQEDMDTVIMLLDCLTYAASQPIPSKFVKDNTLNTIVDAIVTYMSKNSVVRRKRNE